MTKQDKELLIKDLCARLPYGVKIKFNDGTDDVYNLNGNIHGKFTENVIQAIDDLELKPYLRPMSSMTEEEKKEYCDLQAMFLYSSQYPVTDAYALFDWLNAHHIDFRNLIPMGLALPAPEGMYNF